MRYRLIRLMIMGLWFALDRTGQLVLSQSIALQQTPQNLLSISNTTVWQNPYRSRILMIAEAKVVSEALVIGSMQAKLHIPQQPIK